MQKEDIPFLRQLINSLEDTVPKLRKAYEKKDADDFNEIKSFMLKIQKQVENILNVPFKKGTQTRINQK